MAEYNGALQSMSGLETVGNLVWKVAANLAA